MQLLDLIFVERNVLPGLEHEIHQLGVAGHLLLVTCLERMDSQIREQLLDFAVRELAAFDAG